MSKNAEYEASGETEPTLLNKHAFHTTPNTQASAVQEISPELLDRLRFQARNNLYFFTKGVLGFNWLVPHIHLQLTNALQDQKNTRLRVVFPRGWLKTTCCSQAYPIWRAVNDPNVRVLLTQNTFTNACSKLATIDKVFKENGLFRALFPEILPDRSCTWKTESMCVKREKGFPESTFEAAGTRTQVTSRHYDVIIEDDTVAPDFDELGEQALCPTKEDIELAIGWHRLAMPLLTDMHTGQIVIVGTRWFEKDLISWNRDNEPSYKGIERGCRETGGVIDPSGELTYPERFGSDVLRELEAALGPYLFSCLYLNTPVSSATMEFKPEWVEYYDTEPTGLLTYTTVDPAGDPEDSKGEPDWNVVHTTGKSMRTGDIYDLEYTRKKCTPGELIADIFNHVRRWHPVKVGVETVQYQKSLQYWIRERMRQEGVWFAVEGLTNVRRSKEMRIRGLIPLFAAGKIHVRRWMGELVNELVSFPRGKNDDLIDSLAMQLELWAMTSGEERERRKTYSDDPLQFEWALRTLQDRNKKKRGLVMAGLQAM